MRERLAVLREQAPRGTDGAAGAAGTEAGALDGDGATEAGAAERARTFTACSNRIMPGPTSGKETQILSPRRGAAGAVGGAGATVLSSVAFVLDAIHFCKPACWQL